MTKFDIAMDNCKKRRVDGEIETFEELPNEQFGFHKDKDSTLWTITHIRSGLEIKGKNKSLRVAKNNLKKILSDPEKVRAIQQAPDLKDVLKQAKDREEKYQRFSELKLKFQDITGIDLPRCPWTGGVDVARLDAIMQTPDGISLADYIKQKYGEDAYEIVAELI